MSLALAHKRRLKALGPAAAVAGAVATVYSAETALNSPANAKKHLKLIVDALNVDLDRLSSIDSLELRQQLKRDELLPKYLDYVQRYLDSKLIFPNPVMMQVLVWLFDTQQFTSGLQLADVAMLQGQEMPERFKRNVQTFVGDQVIDWAEAEYKAGRSPEPYVSDLLHLVDGEWQLFERIPARYHKLLGIISLDLEEWSQAIDHFERAIELYPEIGVGVRLDAARKALKKAELAAVENPPTE
ncbi:phage terminase small subunit [Pseudomonas quasicaspiana]|uniref:phage terminase small subunit n=1 Tax=Pseudomonas quasicaspiana TaxID=2829821 RepID=UPI001E36DC4D|nr:phage terminase small subunit [Pseudomonas quasicaspiana]MCD5970420.1 terminase [Pseudomonas quasicaspiana]